MAVESGEDLTRWDFWWGFNREPYQRLQSKIDAYGTITGSDDFFLGKNEHQQAKDTLRPTEVMIRGKVVPELRRVLSDETSADLLSAALVALAKIGDVASEDGASEFVALITERLASNNQEVSETAAIALGILGDERALPLLVALMNDEALGRKAVRRDEVPDRTRTFAAYGLGLIGHRAPSNGVRQDVAERLVEVLEQPPRAQYDLQVGAMNALGLVTLDWTDTPTHSTGKCHAHVLSRSTLIRYLRQYMDPAHEGDWRVRTHAPIALGRLIQAEPAPESADAREAVVAVLETLIALVEVRQKERPETTQSAIIALGMSINAGAPSDRDDMLGRANGAARARLMRIAASSSDAQSEHLALIALAECGARLGAGGQDAAAQRSIRDLLLAQVAHAKGQKVAWASLALGVYGRGALENGGSVDATIVGALRLRLTGLVCDKDDSPWNTKLAVHCNYGATTTTSRSGGGGVLELL